MRLAFVCSVSCNTSPQDPFASTDRDALGALFRSTGGPGWTRGDNWNTDADLSTWAGVKTNERGRVVKLSLDENNLHGNFTVH